MPEAPVVNASPLIYLARSGRLELLQSVTSLLACLLGISGPPRRRSWRGRWLIPAREPCWTTWPGVEQLREAGMYLSDRVLNRALSLVDE